MKISITDEYAEREHLVGTLMNVDYREIGSFLKALGKRAASDTGLLPPGVLSFRQAGEHTQIVLQLPPAVNLICWGASERDPKAENYTLAQPYRIIIGETNKGQMLGARCFYSPVPITQPDQILYHQNLPNTNCKGYRGTGVGWICLYHTEDWGKYDLAQRCVRLGLRASGNEAYNNANMPSTDGPHFYSEEYGKRYGEDYMKYDFLWNPKKWEKKSQKEGVDWTLNEGLWIPVLVKGLDDQAAHTPTGTPLTLAMAMNGKARFYYQDEMVKDFHYFVRDDLGAEPKAIEWAKAAYAEAKPTTPPQVIPMGDPLPDFGGAAPVLPSMDMDEYAQVNVLPNIDEQGMVLGGKKK